MAQENIWKKQAQMNRLKAQGKAETSTHIQTGSPINAFMKSNNNSGQTPPWAKNAPPSNSSQQPPWARNSPTQPDNSPVQPPWTNKPTSPPVVASNPSNNTTPTPPWAKNTATTSQQPAWVKNNATTQESPKVQSTGNVAPWAKNNTSKPADNVNGLPWVKKNDSPQKEQKPSDNQPSWAKQRQNDSKTGTTNPTPPWMNRRDSSQSPTTPWSKNDSPEIHRKSWKLNQSNQIEKQKQELEEQIRKQEEEEKQKKRIARQKKQKEEEMKRITIELELMAKEDVYSSERQRYDKEQEERKYKEKRQEEQRKSLQQQQRRLQEQKRKQEQQERQCLKKQEQEKARRAQQQKLRMQTEQSQRKQKEKQGQLDRSAKSEPSKDKTKKGPLSRRKKKQINLQTSKISSIKAIQNMNVLSEADPSLHQNMLPQNTYHKYLRLINEETIEYDYKKKISIQKSIYQLQLQCRRQCQKQLTTLLSSKKVTNRKRKIIYSNSMQVQYALCEGRKGQNGVQFDTDEVNQLRNRFLQYEVLTKSVLSLMKKKINLHLRVPLINYGQYKGVSFLVEHVCQQLTDIIEIQVSLFQEISNEVLVFEKQLQLNMQNDGELKPLSKQQLMAKKITIEQQDYYILYIKNQSKLTKIKQAYNSSGKLISKVLPKYSHLNDLNLLQYVIGQNAILPYYQPSFDVNKENYVELEKVASPALKGILKNICLANAIHTVYSSCQGQVDQESFFQLVIEGNKEMWDMICAAGAPDRNVPKPIVLAYLEKISSVRFNFTKNMFSRKKKQLIKSIQPCVYIQRYDYQLLEFIKNIDKYIIEDKEELVEQSLAFSRELWEQCKEGQNQQEFNFIKIKNEVSCLLYKQKQSQGIELIEKTKQKVNDLGIESIPLHILGLKSYIAKDMQVPMLKTLAELLPALQFYFGQQSMLHALVYTAVGNYYSKKTQQQISDDSHMKKVVTFYQHALNIALKLYGQKSLQVADIYLSRASAFVHLAQYEQFDKDIHQAMRIYKSHSKSGPKIAQCNHLMGRVKCLQGHISEGIELMELSSSQYMKMYNHIESICILFQILPFLQSDQTALQSKIEQIVQICFTYKSIWPFKRIATAVLDRQLNCYTSLTIRNLQELFTPLDEDQRTNEEVLIDLEEEIKGFTSFIQIVRWGLSIIAGKMAARREATSDYEKAHSIIREVFHFYGKSQPISMDLRDSQLL